MTKQTKNEMMRNRLKDFNKSDQDLLIKYANERNIKFSTVAGYVSTWKKYTKLNNMSITELLEEAKKEQKQRINPNETTLRKRLLKYREQLLNIKSFPTKKGKSPSRATYTTYLSKIETVYRHFNIYVPELPRVNIDKGYVASYGDLPTKDMLKKACKFKPALEPYILFASSSGSAKSEALSITVGMFLKGCAEYTDVDGDIYAVLEDLVTRDDIVPSIYLRRIKTDKWYTTFCSPEASKSIIQELLMRYDVDNRGKLTRESKLFPFSPSWLITSFQAINDHFMWGFVGNYRLFRSHTLRKFNASNLGCNAEFIDAIQGRSRNVVHETYIKHNPKELKKTYIKHMRKVMLYPEKYPIAMGNSDNTEINDTSQSISTNNTVNPVQVQNTTSIGGGTDIQVYIELGKLQEKILQLEQRIQELEHME